MINIRTNYPIFHDFDGTPLKLGKIYIGEENKNPIQYPISVYWDKDFYHAAEQPIITNNGIPIDYNNNPSTFYVSQYPFSILILNEFGEKIHYNPSMYLYRPDVSNKNLVTNGNFKLFGTYYQNYTDRRGPDNIYHYIAQGHNDGANTSSYQWVSRNYDIGDIDKHYLRYIANSNPAADSAETFINLVHILEDVYPYNGKELSLSFYHSADSIEHFKEISISLSIIDDSGSEIHFYSEKITLSKNWEKFETTFKVPQFTDDDIDAGYPDNLNTCLLIKIWPFAGTDYYGETNFLENEARSSSYNLNISQLKLEYGGVPTPFKSIPYELISLRNNRRFETTFENNGFPSFGNQTGYMMFVSPGVQSYIPGFRYRQMKRNGFDTTVRIYSYSTKNEGYVTLVGTGDIAVTAINDVGFTGCGTISLASNTAAGNVYKFHYIVENEFSI